MAMKNKQAQAKTEDRQLKIKLVRSLIGRPRKHREVVRGLGLRKLNSVVIRKDCPEIWGMIRKIPHLVEVEVLEKK
jgi:large subunit ribosomal protein L30